MRDVPLRPGIPHGKWARLRPLCGRDEILVDASGFVDRLAFIDGLLMEASGTTVKPGGVRELALCDCDRLCASIYLDCFGEFIEGRLTCNRCREYCEMKFSLVDLMRNMMDPIGETDGPDERGTFTSPSGRHFRLPTARDHEETAGLGAVAAIASLRARCIVDGDPSDVPQDLETSMEQVGPTLDRDLDAVCPQCGATQAVRFDIQSYLFRALGYERQFLLYEIHRIAAAYGWTYEETLGLTREDRRKLVRLIESDHMPRRRPKQWKSI
jgi:hypothetical protein